MQGIHSRRIVLDLLMDVDKDGSYSNLVLKQALSSNNVSEKDAAFITGLFYGTLENIIKIDYIISLYAKGSRIHRYIRCVLRMGIQQILFMRVSDSAAISTSVELVKKSGKKSLSGFTNAVLRQVMNNRDNIPYPNEKDEPIKYLSVMFSCPHDIVKMWVDDYGYDFTKDMLSYEEKVGMSSIRVNTLKADPDSVFDSLESAGYVTNRAKYYDDVRKVSDLGDVTKQSLFMDGSFTIMGESSMIVVDALDPKPGKTVLDACAAPGGKSAYIAQKMQNKGVLYAWDKHLHRVDLLNSTLKRLGVSIAKTDARDATVYDEEFENKFDAVLVDAPCSGWGVMMGKPDIRLQKQADDTFKLAKIQLSILNTVSRYVKKGGVLVYSTCTISKNENEKVVERFLKENKGYKADSWAHLLPQGIDGTRIKDGGIPLYPHIDYVDGFFIARLVKEND